MIFKFLCRASLLIAILGMPAAYAAEVEAVDVDADTGGNSPETVQAWSTILRGGQHRQPIAPVLPPPAPVVDAPAPAVVTEPLSASETPYPACQRYVTGLVTAWQTSFNDAFRTKFPEEHRPSSSLEEPSAKRQRTAYGSWSSTAVIASVPLAAVTAPAVGAWSLVLPVGAYVFHVGTTVIPPVYRGMIRAHRRVRSAVLSGASRVCSQLSPNPQAFPPSINAIVLLTEHAPVTSSEVQDLLRADATRMLDALSSCPSAQADSVRAAITAPENQTRIIKQICSCIQTLLRTHYGSVDLATVETWVTEIMAHRPCA